MTGPPTRAVVLAAGRGTRMQREAPGVRLAREQAEAASQGLKGLVPIHGEPFLSYVLTAVADAGFREVCLVVGPQTGKLRKAFQALRTRRLRISFAEQAEPRGSAHALLSAEPFAVGEPFLLLNSDNHYPAPVLAALREAPAPALAGFRRESLLRTGSIPPERIASFAMVEAAADGTLLRIVEKPDPERLASLGADALVSMNCWLFTPEIFDACRAIEPSPRGELELPQAVQYASEMLGSRFRVVPVDAPVLDLSGRGDVAAVEAGLAGIAVRL